ncbi:probable phospholipid hydroperoxide glutathione peroxidase [Hibiscus syriacus]|nr:probable phospholipid hydroperoxide glutathione peroxidase [Hibiscus syriacus]
MHSKRLRSCGKVKLSPQVSPVYLLSHSIQTQLPRSLVGCLRFDRTMAVQSSKGSIHGFTIKDAKGNDVDLSIYKGKVLLIVNVASQCGLTNSNYTKLSQLYKKYKDQDSGIFV